MIYMCVGRCVDQELARSLFPGDSARPTILRGDICCRMIEITFFNTDSKRIVKPRMGSVLVQSNRCANQCMGKAQATSTG